MIIRMMLGSDVTAWRAMRAQLWPESTPHEHEDDVAGIIASADRWGFIAEAGDGTPLGFAELSIRRYANGCTEMPVPFLEGIWVDPAWRRRGIARRLVQHIAEFVRAQGFRELCSDALLDNTDSHAAHARWGFAETERVVCFRKAL